MGGVEFTEVWGPPSTVWGRLVQVGFLSTLFGAAPLALAGYALRRIHRGQRTSGWVNIARAGALLQVVSIVSTLLVGGLLLSEAETLRELAGPWVPILALGYVNLVSSALGLHAWRALGRAARNAG